MHGVVGDLMFANNFYIALYDADERTLNYPYYRDEVDLDIPDPEAWEPMGTGQARGLTAYVLRTGMPQLVTKERFHQLIADGEIEQVGEDGEDWMGVPLIDEGKSIGVAVVQTYEAGLHYTQEDVDLLTFVGQHIASALSRARAIAETKRLLLETKQRAAELTAHQRRAGRPRGAGRLRSRCTTWLATRSRSSSTRRWSTSASSTRRSALSASRTRSSAECAFRTSRSRSWASASTSSSTGEPLLIGERSRNERSSSARRRRSRARRPSRPSSRRSSSAARRPASSPFRTSIARMRSAKRT